MNDDVLWLVDIRSGHKNGLWTYIIFLVDVTLFIMAKRHLQV